MKSHLRLLLAYVAAVLSGLWPSSLVAADRFWIAPNGGQFGATAFWSTTAGGPGGASVPGPADTANFTLDETYEVAFLADATNFMLDVEDGDVTFDLRGRTYTVASNQAQTIDVGLRDGRTARLTVQGGTLAVDTNGKQVVIGSSDGGAGSSIGFLTITSGGHLGNATTRPDIFVGRSGAGTLTVNENGRIDGRTFLVGSFGGNNGTVTITGPSAVADISGNTTIGLGDSIFAGSAVAGTVSVTNGGTLTSAASVLLGDNLGAHGSVSVGGAGSSWIIAGISTIGEDGDGTLTITSGGLVSSAAAVTLGNTATGFGTSTITGANSRWTLSNTQTIGSSGLGVMTVSNGGQVTSSSSAVLGSAAGSEGRVTVTGAGSQWTLANPLTIGDLGTGQLTISAGGEVSTTIVILGNSAAASAGVATITGGGSKLTTSGNVTVANIGAGTLNVADDAEVYVGGNLHVNDPAGGPVGTLNLDGGSIYVAGNFTNLSAFNFTDGLLRVSGNFQPLAGANVVLINGADTGDLPTLDLIGSGPTSVIGAFTIGNNRHGQLLVRQGRVIDLQTNFINIGALVGSQGLISVQSGAFLGAGPLAVGGAGSAAGGTGTLEISGGTVDVATLRLFRDGTINLASGTLAVNTLPVLDGQLNWTGGTLRFDAAFSLTSANVPKLLGLDARIRPGQAISSAAGQAVTLQTPLIVDGGSLSASSLINQSRLEVRSGSIGSVQNDGLITGDGTITGAVTNSAAGTIRVDGGKSLYFTGTVAPNAGEMNLQGGTLEYSGAVTNSATGRINGRGTLDFAGGLTNAGKMQFSGGPTDIFGNVTFTGGAGGGEMINSGGGNVVTFYDNVTHNGDEIRTSPTNTTVFFGNVNGAGPFTGTGAVRFEGTFSPGLSPAEVSMEGSADLSGGARLVMELGGTVPGDQHDQLEVEGLLSLGGKLEVTLLDGFAPRYGDTFDLLDFGALSGRFDTFILPVLDAGLVWDTSGLYSTGAIAAVPEPSTWVLALIGLFFALATLRRASVADSQAA